MGVNSLPKSVTRQRRGCDLNPGPSAPESSTLTSRLPSHPFLQWKQTDVQTDMADCIDFKANKSDDDDCCCRRSGSPTLLVSIWSRFVTFSTSVTRRPSVWVGPLPQTSPPLPGCGWWRGSRSPGRRRTSCVECRRERFRWRRSV